MNIDKIQRLPYMHIRNIILPLLLTVCALHAERNVGIDINSKDVEVITSFSLNQLNYYTDGTNYVIDASYLHTENNTLTTIGFSGENAFQGIQGLSLSFGLKAAIASDFIALPLYAKAIYRLPLNDRVPPTYLTTSFAYAPSVLSFSDAESYTEFRFEADMEVISNIHIFTGYRNINTKFIDTKKTWDNHFYAGLKFSF